MRKSGLCFAVLQCTLLLLAGGLQGQSGFVHTSGPALVDASGKPLLLRGINLGNWFVPEGYMFHLKGGPQSPREIEGLTKELIGPEKAEAFWHAWRESYITEPDLDRLKSEGFNSVRVPFHWKFFDSDDGEGFRLVDRLVQWARKDGIYIILDMHCAPGGQTGINIDDSWGYPWLFRIREAQEHTIAVWRRIAAHYSQEPIILGYDLLNEPIPPFAHLDQYNKDLEPFYRRVAEAIRSVDRNHVLILGGAQWDTNFKVFGPPFDPNVMYTFHRYWTSPDEAGIAEYLQFRQQYNVPIWLGESGENQEEWIAALRKTLEATQVGWCFWPYKKMDATTSVVSFDPPTHWKEIVKLAASPSATADPQRRIAARPSPEDAQAIFDDLLSKIQFSSEHVNESYVRALGLKP